MLAANELPLEYAQNVLYEALRLQCFASVCDALKEDKKSYLSAVNEYRKMDNPAAFAKKMVTLHCGCKLDDESYALLGRLFVCFFRKSNSRVAYPDSLRKKLALIQGNVCAICGNPISYVKSKSELDHIIPWTYVGDILEDNLQLLCHDCNSRKRSSILYSIKVMLRSGRFRKTSIN